MKKRIIKKEIKDVPYLNLGEDKGWTHFLYFPRYLERQSDIYSGRSFFNLEDVANAYKYLLHELKTKYPDQEKFLIEYNSKNSGDNCCTEYYQFINEQSLIFGYKTESDKEFEARLKKREEQKAASAKTRKKNLKLKREKQEQEERAQLAKLKAKYGE